MGQVVLKLGLNRNGELVTELIQGTVLGEPQGFVIGAIALVLGETGTIVVALHFQGTV
jgi:hypothetical protein